MDLPRTASKTKETNFSDPVYFTPPAEWVSLKFCNSVEHKKRMMPYQNVKKCDDIYICLIIIPALDRQTDSQTISYRAVSCDKNSCKNSVSASVHWSSNKIRRNFIGRTESSTLAAYMPWSKLFVTRMLARDLFALSDLLEKSHITVTISLVTLAFCEHFRCQFEVCFCEFRNLALDIRFEC